MIYVLGDSSSSGTELADHLISNWPGHKSTKSDHATYQKWVNDPARQKEIDELLFCNIKAFKKWNEKYSLSDIKEGDFLDFFRVVPTYSDRKSFYLAILDT